MPDTEAPDPVPSFWLRSLLAEYGISQGEAARLLRVDPATFRRWVMPSDAKSRRPCPWAAAELLRRILRDG